MIAAQSYKTWRFFISGAVLLILAMVALHATVAVINEQQALQAIQTLQHLDEASQLSQQATPNLHIDQISAALERLENKNSYLYWTVFTIGLFAFVLVVIFADRMRDLEEANQEKKMTLAILQSRLAAMDATLDGIAISDKQGRLSYLNTAMQEMFNHKHDGRISFKNGLWHDLFDETIRDEYSALIEQDIKSNEDSIWSGIIDVDAQSPHHGPKQIELAVKRLSDGTMIFNARDISQRLKNEIERKDMQMQLYQAQKMEAIGRLTGGIAHDFNNILAAMNGYAEFLIEDLEEGTTEQSFAQNILNAGMQARTLVDHMLAFSRQRDGVMEEINFIEPVEEALSMLNASLPRSIELRTNILGSKTMIAGNATQISQIIMNLCLNAKDAIQNHTGLLEVTTQIVKPSEIWPQCWLSDELPSQQTTPPLHMVEGEAGRTSIYLGQIDKNHEYICLKIKDDGSGMSRSIMEHVFDPFFTTKPVNKGTGLGLSIVQGVMLEHKGAIHLSSEPEKGTQFNLFFPLGTQAEQEKQVALPRSEITGVTGIVLLVDDQPEVLGVTARMLERAGCDVITAESGTEALEVLKDSPQAFDLVMTDQNMPKMKGTEFIRRASEIVDDMPFIILSGYSEQKLEDFKKTHAQIRAVMTKPVAKQELGQTVLSVLSLYPRASKQKKRA